MCRIDNSYARAIWANLSDCLWRDRGSGGECLNNRSRNGNIEKRCESGRKVITKARDIKNGQERCWFRLGAGPKTLAPKEKVIRPLEFFLN
jgi:hypothetical protein